MFKHIKDKYLRTETTDVMNAVRDNRIRFNPRRPDTSILYIQAIEDHDLQLVKVLILDGMIDVNFRVRMNSGSRSDNDIIPLAVAITRYDFEMAELLIDLGHTTEGFKVLLSSNDKENMFMEDYKKAVQFCKDHNIEYVEVGDED